MKHLVSRESYCSFIIAFFLSIPALYAQEDYTPKFGVINKSEFEMSSVSSDSTADAILLYDCADITFRNISNKGIVMVYKYWGRIKIQKESGLERASVTVPLRKGSYNMEEVISDIDGVTHNMEGEGIKFEKMSKSALVRETVSDKFNMVKFNLPNVKKGSIIEYTYTKETPLKTQDHPDTWQFQGGIPIKWSEFRIIVPEFLFYKMTMGGYLGLHINSQKNISYNVGVPGTNSNATSYRFVVKDAPAFLNEPYITSVSDYVSNINFELSSISLPGTGYKSFSSTWENVDKTFQTIGWFGGQLKKWSFIKDAANAINLQTQSPKNKMWMAYEHTRNIIKWNDKVGIGADIKKAFDNKKGNVADVNLYLVNLLRELGLEANPVVLSTRSNGRVNEHIPSLEKFNYVVAHVLLDGKAVLLDASDPNLFPGMLPEHALNEFGRLIPNSKNGEFVSLAPIYRRSILHSVEASIAPESGEISGDYKLSLGGYEGLKWKREYSGDVKKYEESLISGNPEWDFENVEVMTKPDSSNLTINIGYNFVTEGQSAQRIYLNPILGGQIKKHNFTSEERIYPLDFTTTSQETYLGKYKIPEGYIVEETPKSEIINLPDNGGSFRYTINNQNGIVTVTSSIALNRTLYTSEEYPYLRQFFDLIVQKHSQPIVIKMK